MKESRWRNDSVRNTPALTDQSAGPRLPGPGNPVKRRTKARLARGYPEDPSRAYAGEEREETSPEMSPAREVSWGTPPVHVEEGHSRPSRACIVATFHTMRNPFATFRVRLREGV